MLQRLQTEPGQPQKHKPLKVCYLLVDCKKESLSAEMAKHSFPIPHASLTFDTGPTDYTVTVPAAHAKVNNSHPDGLIVGAGEQLRAVGRKLDPLHPAQVSAAVGHLLIAVQVPQLQIINTSVCTHFEEQFNYPTKQEGHKGKDMQG